jgi:hypothetical protein
MSQIIRNEYRTIQAKNNMKYKGLIIQISIFSDHLKWKDCQILMWIGTAHGLFIWHHIIFYGNVVHISDKFHSPI